MARDRRTVERVMLAASSVAVSNAREAAVLGGIVRSLLDAGHFDGNYVSHYTGAAMEWAEPIARSIYRGTCEHDTMPFMFPPGGRATPIEIARMSKAFIAHYDPGKAAA